VHTKTLGRLKDSRGVAVGRHLARRLRENDDSTSIAIATAVGNTLAASQVHFIGGLAGIVVEVVQLDFLFDKTGKQLGLRVWLEIRLLHSEPP
jgi:hypothetical protein